MEYLKLTEIDRLTSNISVVNQKNNENCRLQLQVGVVICHKQKQNRRNVTVCCRITSLIMQTANPTLFKQ